MNEKNEPQSDMPADRDEERRRSPRRRVLKSGLASYNKDYTTVPCVMRNINADGARLDFDELAAVPSTFTLHVGIDGYRIECERVWREGKACGVRFVGEKASTPIFHAQKIDTAENSLSEPVLRAMELHRQARDDDEVRPAVIEIHARRPKSHKPAFGRRT